MMTNVSEVFRLDPFQHHVDSFVDLLHAKRYVPQSVAIKRSIIMAFARWSQSERIGVDDLDEDNLSAFVKRRPLRPTSAVEMRALRQFLRHLRVERGLPVSAASKSASLVDDLTERYFHYLRAERGRRDYAILLLLARLGLRAGEIVALELSDIHWRAGEILVRGKGHRLDHVPLLADVGEAVAPYLREDHRASISRRLFLRLIPPHIGLTGPCSIDPIVRMALGRAGVRPRHRCVAHLFRHSLATRIIRHGASMAEIAEVLRHRSQGTTAIYAKVSFDALRTVARPWPVSGGAQ